MPKTDHFAVVVGIGLYPGVGDLEGPVYDASDFVEWLKSPTGGDLPTGNIHQWPSPQPNAHLRRPAASDAHPNADEIDSLFRPLYEPGLDAPVGKRLYIFVSGHGINDRTDVHSVALLAANYTPSDPVHVAMVKRAEWFHRHAAFDEIILFADCCRTNPGYELTSPQWPDRWTTRANPRASKIRRLYGLATGYGKESRERDFGNGMTRGIFSRTLLKSLSEAQPDATGRVTGVRLQDHVHNILEHVAGDVRVDPPDFSNSEFAEDIVFRVPSTVATCDVVVTIQPRTGHDTLVVSQNFTTVERFCSAGSPLTLQLVPGIYKIEIGGTDRHQLIEVPKDHECVL